MTDLTQTTEQSMRLVHQATKSTLTGWLGETETAAREMRRGHERLPGPMICPSWGQYVSSSRMRDGTLVTIRPIRPEDEPLIVKFHKTLSDRSVYFRYFHMINLGERISHQRLQRICHIDTDREMVLVAVYRETEEGTRQILGVGRLSKLEGVNEAEFAILVSDRAQGRGLGGELLRRLIRVASDQKIDRVRASILLENRHMQRVCEKLGFGLHYSAEEGLVKAELSL